ncbi:MAG: TetR/AcrR family transcriptional repressor of nem operon [Psychromonas sp.]|jgi:TetR/AcrR family transcriptional repressor of nem operon|uniref:TetR/AcrR family transcriptional regulator n=1 Tax=Psychromonas sp. TaxID=1884585 RepID=UPI0039E22CB0
MANISKFDRENVLEKAKNLFWQKGFLGTSTRELQAVINLRPGSIYAAFGSKSALFQEVLRHYAKISSEELHQHTQGNPSVLAGLKQYLHNILSNEHNTLPNELCLLVKTLSELDDSYVDILLVARELLKQIEDTFAKLLHQAKVQHELPADTDENRLAKHLQIQIIGLRFYLKATGDSKTVSQQLNTLFEQLPHQAFLSRHVSN